MLREWHHASQVGARRGRNGYGRRGEHTNRRTVAWRRNGGRWSGTLPIEVLSIALSPSHLLVLHPPEWEPNKEFNDFIHTLLVGHNLIQVQSPADNLYSASELDDSGPIRIRKAIAEAFDLPEQTTPESTG